MRGRNKCLAFKETVFKIKNPRSANIFDTLVVCEGIFFQLSDWLFNPLLNSRKGDIESFSNGLIELPYTKSLIACSLIWRGLNLCLALGVKQ